MPLADFVHLRVQTAYSLSSGAIRVKELVSLCKAERMPARLSGGEQQRVAIARALANDPRILLGDEPTGNLDHATGDSVLSTLLDLVRHTGLAALIATHNLARRLDRIVALEDGRLRPLD